MYDFEYKFTLSIPKKAEVLSILNYANYIFYKIIVG